MSRRHTVILILAAVFLTAFSVALSRQDSRDWRATRSRRLFPFPWQDTVSIAIAKPGEETLRFEKNTRGEWRILLADDQADTLSYSAIDEFAALATLTWREPIPEGREPDPDQAATLTAVSIGGQTLRLIFGDIANHLRAVRVDGDYGVVYGVNRDLLKFLDWPPERWRNFNLASAGSGRLPKKITLFPGGVNPELKIGLELGDSGWRQTIPVAWPVDETRLELLLRWLDRLRAESIEAEMTADLAWFGFGPDSAFVETEYDGPAGLAIRRVEFGTDAGDGRIYAREDGRTPVFAVSRSMLAEISLDAAAAYPVPWRNFYRFRSINAVGEELPAAITVERLLPKPAKLNIEQPRDRDLAKWRGRLEENEGIREFLIDPPDPAEPMRPLTALLTGLSSMRVKAFLADSSPGTETIKWTAYPAWRFSCLMQDGTIGSVLTLYSMDAEGNLPAGEPFVEGLSGPQPMTPHPGAPANAGIAFSLDDRQAVMEMFGELSYLLCLPPYRYQSRQFLDSDPRDWVRVEITSVTATEIYTRDLDGVNEQWWRGEGRSEPLMDDNNPFVAMLLELSRLRTEGLVSDADGGIDEFGLDRPAITVIVYVSGHPEEKENPVDRLFKLSLGGPADARHACLDDSGPVFLMPGRLVDALGKQYR
ncbi:MAG: DUF4340 domain-containing protein [Planctomycetes bacterium]|nr:DUF4340 domain-containing protein [Planctomycetota bacterium]